MWFQVFQFNTNNFLRALFPIDWTLTGTIHLAQNGPKSNGNEGVISHFPKLWELERPY